MSSDSEQDEPTPVGCSFRLREYRHNPCLMKPLAAVMMAVFCVFSLIVAIFQIPGVVLGFFLSPILTRTAWLIEFIYPTGIARWAHFFLLKAAMKTKKITPDKGHSRTTEQRIEVVKGRVYIHPIPQLLDNIAYLVVCCPPTKESSSSATSHPPPIVAFLIDCGDAIALLQQVQAIQKVHYATFHPIEIQAVLSTHKHHDHTAGNQHLVDKYKIGDGIKQVIGGAVEKVPFCNAFVKNKDMLVLPRVDGNDMNNVVQVEVIAVPAHTRGSVVYALRPCVIGGGYSGTCSKAVSYLFTGDTMFSGGAGVPFEADIEYSSDRHTSNKKTNSPIRASVGSKAIERCFVEILHRGLPTAATTVTDRTEVTRQMLIFPGHEYTADIVGRQFHMQDSETSRLNRQTPSVYFETASQLYVSLHRRRLPQGGKLLCVPSPMSRELVINPSYRTLAKRCEHVVRAVRLWHRHFAKQQIVVERVEAEKSRVPRFGEASNGHTPQSDSKTQSTDTRWTLDVNDINRPVFTTIFTDDLRTLIDDLATNRVKGSKAAQRLAAMESKLKEPTVGRRPIPDTLPSEKNAYLAVLAFAMLGSPPCAMTLSDSLTMNLPVPMRGNETDPILISKRRLMSVLECFGFIAADDGSDDVASMVHLLWKEAADCGLSERGVVDSTNGGIEASECSDQIELGVLRWMLFGVESNPSSWYSKFCMPCTSDTGKKEVLKFPREHPVQKLKMRRTGGELVRHDVLSCMLCRDAAGCLDIEKDSGSDGAKTNHSGGAQRDMALDMPIANENGIEVFPSVTEEADDISTNGGLELVHLPPTILLRET